MLNWKYDVPRGSKEIFVNALELVRDFEDLKVLEIGTFAGTSIGTIATILPKAECTAIDNWSLDQEELKSCFPYAGRYFTMNDVKEAFYKNTDNKVKLIEEDSTKALSKMVSDRVHSFGFIYVDGSHTTLDTALDLTLAWFLLQDHGVFAIDDYLWCPPGREDNCPRPAIDHFLSKYNGKYEIINKGYRLFLRKLPV